MTTKELRLKAAALLEESGWCQGGYLDAGGRMCLVGALIRAWDTAGLETPRVGVQQALAEMGLDTPETWNDAPGRTQADVLDKLREGVQ